MDLHDDRQGEAPSPALIEYMQKTMKHFRVYSEAQSLNSTADCKFPMVLEDPKLKNHRFLIKEFSKPILKKSYLSRRSVELPKQEQILPADATLNRSKFSTSMPASQINWNTMDQRKMKGLLEKKPKAFGRGHGECKAFHPHLAKDRLGWDSPGPANQYKIPVQKC